MIENSNGNSCNNIISIFYKHLILKPRQHVHSLCSFTWANVPMHCKLATKQSKGPKLLRKKFNQEVAAFWRGAKSGFLVKLSLMGLFDETFSKSFCPSPPVAAEGGFGGGRRHLI